jgi:hypothetical protein
MLLNGVGNIKLADEPSLKRPRSIFESKALYA